MGNHLRQSQYICRDIVYFGHIRSKSSKRLKPCTVPKVTSFDSINLHLHIHIIFIDRQS